MHDSVRISFLNPEEKVHDWVINIFMSNGDVLLLYLYERNPLIKKLLISL